MLSSNPVSFLTFLNIEISFSLHFVSRVLGYGPVVGWARRLLASLIYSCLSMNTIAAPL